jgi:hypothetical protein
VKSLEPKNEEIEYIDEFSEEPMDDPSGDEFDKMIEGRLVMAIEIVRAAKGIT